MTVLSQQSHSASGLENAITKSEQERLRETIRFLEKLSLDQEAIANQRVELANALLRASVSVKAL